MTLTGARRYAPIQPAQQVEVVATDQCLLKVRVFQEPKAKDAVPILFVHALALDGDMWQGVAKAIEAMKPSFTGAIYAIDCRGHGKSEATVAEFSTKQFADDLLCVLKAVGATSAHIVGCSMGGTVALSFAGQFPIQTASITVIDASIWYGLDAQTNWEKRAQTALEGGMEALIEFQRPRWFSSEFIETQALFVADALEIFTANQIASYVKSCRMLGKADEREIIKNYLGPAMVIVGEEDYATPLSMAEDIAARIPHSKLRVIPKTRHFTPLEAPELVAKYILEIIG